MVKLTLNREWLDRDHQPRTLTDSPFGAAIPATLAWGDVAHVVTDHSPWEGSLESFAAELVGHVRHQLRRLKGMPVHLAVSGGYDSRILLALALEEGLDPLCCGDGTQDPPATATMDYLSVPKKRRYVHDLDQDDPYGVSEVEIMGCAPLYFGMSFFTPDEKAVLVTGLGGGEWFSYPAAGWHNGHRARTPRKTLVDWWMDTWPNYWLLPVSWAQGYAGAVHPYTESGYAAIATKCHSEWLVETRPEIELDAVREAMLAHLDPGLVDLGYAPHRYDWRLSKEQEDWIDDRFAGSWLGKLPEMEGVRPSRMHHDVHACTMGGLATWCDIMIDAGTQIQ